MNRIAPLCVLLLAACTQKEEAATPVSEPAQPAAEAAPPAAAAAGAPATQGSFYGLASPSLEGQPVAFDQYQGKVALVVNVASKCGYTPQYAGLQELYEQYKDQGLVVLGFPSNEFGGQEPGSAREIRSFCTKNFGVDFPLFEKQKVKAPNQSPVYAFLEAKTGEVPGWNFCKYLVDRSGANVVFFPSKVSPSNEELVAAIEAALKEGA